MKLPPPRDIVTQISLLHVGVAESVQSADAKHVVTTAVSGSDSVSRQRGRGGHCGRFINWSRGHARHECRLCAHSGPATFSFPTTVAGTSHDDFPCNINGNELPVCVRFAAKPLFPCFPNFCREKFQQALLRRKTKMTMEVRPTQFEQSLGKEAWKE